MTVYEVIRAFLAVWLALVMLISHDLDVEDRRVLDDTAYSMIVIGGGVGDEWGGK